MQKCIAAAGNMLSWLLTRLKNWKKREPLANLQKLYRVFYTLCLFAAFEWADAVKVWAKRRTCSMSGGKKQQLWLPISVFSSRMNYGCCSLGSRSDLEPDFFFLCLYKFWHLDFFITSHRSSQFRLACAWLALKQSVCPPTELDQHF